LIAFVPRRAKQIKLGPEPIEASKNLPGINGRRGGGTVHGPSPPEGSTANRSPSAPLGWQWHQARHGEGAEGQARRAQREARNRPATRTRGSSASAWHGRMALIDAERGRGFDRGGPPVRTRTRISIPSPVGVEQCPDLASAGRCRPPRWPAPAPHARLSSAPPPTLPSPVAPDACCRCTSGPPTGRSCVRGCATPPPASSCVAG